MAVKRGIDKAVATAVKYLEDNLARTIRPIDKGGREDLENIAIVGGGIGREIVFSFEHPRQPRHALLVQAIRVMMRIGPLKRATDLLAHHAIFVSLGLGVETRMKFGMNLFGREHARQEARLLFLRQFEPQPVHR